MDPTIYAVISFGLVVAVTGIVGSILLYFLWAPVAPERIQMPRSTVTGGTILRWEEQSGARWRRQIERIGRIFVPRDRVKLSRLRERLSWAGFHDPRAARYFLGAKVGCLIFFGCAYYLGSVVMQRVLPNMLAVSMLLGVIGCFVPDFWLRMRTQARQREVLHALPNVLDLLLVCIEAGLGFDAAVARVSERPEVRGSPLHQEMLRMHLEVRAGRPREEAMRGLGERTGVEEIKALVGAFIQTERLGTSLGKTLRVHAESARVQRRLRAEERAHMAPLKMLFPTVVFLFPVFFLVTFAPSLLLLVTALGSIK
ncbi:MAG: type II secretion system F family protein [Deltaproteobacteria bacterium]|nr:type II secretion system F family protein [Deltaproteobacteria bacterium]